MLLDFPNQLQKALGVLLGLTTALRSDRIKPLPWFKTLDKIQWGTYLKDLI